MKPIVRCASFRRRETAPRNVQIARTGCLHVYLLSENDVTSVHDVYRSVLVRHQTMEIVDFRRDSFKDECILCKVGRKIFVRARIIVDNGSTHGYPIWISR